MFKSFGWIKCILFIWLTLLLAVFYCPRIQLHTADLGRHIKNGEILFTQHKLVSTNFYSYTEPQYSAINHHWASGAVFYLMWKCAGFYGLSLFYMMILLLAFGIVFFSAVRFSNFWVVLFYSVLCMPLIVTRLEIRPEGFSFLFLTIMFSLLWFDYKKKLPSGWIWIIVLLQVLWVNFHIYFIFGPVLVGAFLINKFIDRDWRGAPAHIYLLLAVMFACLINPYGLKGAIEPFNIFREYGYMLVENQTVLFMQKRFPQIGTYLYFEIVFGIAVFIWLLSVISKFFKKYIALFVIFLFFSLIAWKMIRGIHVWGLIAIPILSAITYDWLLCQKMKIIRVVLTFMAVLGVTGLAVGSITRETIYSPYNRSFLSVLVPESVQGWWFPKVIAKFGILPGTVPGADLAADFFKNNRLQGPIFNNYDIGGYLIYHLFPERVFVDNRPEAYSVEFFQDLFVPMQEDENKWREIDSKYHFNVIFFYRHDLTPWGQPFLIKRINDPQWAPVFVDGYTLILLKRNWVNQDLIKKYELPKSMFGAQKNIGE
ncbi:MAG: hypothetical protein HQL25_03195 [Candidatus Omnitrophica bacterium]|nr:hypothetical protein [Candidatus Omnitrophota bacterium]